MEENSLTLYVTYYERVMNKILIETRQQFGDRNVFVEEGVA